MIVAIEGALVRKSNNLVIIKAGPLNLRVNVPGSTLSKLGDIGSTAFLHTHLYVREDVLALYGFASAQEMSLFEQLITVSGIGPKVALSLLTTLSTEQITTAIMSGDTDLISQVPGIGKKTAGRIVLELKGKLEKGWEGETIISVSQPDSEAVAALTSLGYSIREATQALSHITTNEGMTVEDRVRLALQQLARQ